MKAVLLVLGTLALLAAGPPPGEKDRLRAALGDRDLAGDWIYDDFEAGVAAAAREGKPLLVVLRCVPCKAGRTIDLAVAGRRDRELAQAMERFVCVRIVQGYGLDLSLFQFDWRQPWIAFLMNSDRAIYGRYDAREADDLVGLRKALEGALELHAKWPANRQELAAKTGPPPPWSRPEAIPDLRGQRELRPVSGREGCIHCHNVLDGTVRSLRDRGEPVPVRFLVPYPTPQRVGIMLSSRERATIAEVDRKSPAERAGLKEGDRIVRVGGQPIVSWADVQWALYVHPDPRPLEVEVERDGHPVRATLSLPEDWRSR